MRSSGRAAAEQAGVYLEQELAALSHLPETAETLRRAIEVRFELRGMLNHQPGRFQRSLEVTAEATALAERLGDGPYLGRAAAYLCAALVMVGDDQAAIDQ